MFPVKVNAPSDALRENDADNTDFLRTVIEENRRVKALHQREIQQTAENPRIRLQHEITEISEELRAKKLEDFRRESRRKWLQDNNYELRQLQRQLKIAAVMKELYDQKFECDKRKKEELDRKKSENAEFEKERQRILEEEREREIAEIQKKVEFRSVLQTQMAETNNRQKQSYEVVMKDHEEMLKSFQRMKEENEAEKRELIKRKEAIRKDTNEFLRISREFKKHQEQVSKEENINLMKYIEESEEKARLSAEEKRKKLERHEALSRKIGLQLNELENEKRKRENLLLDLLVEELKAKDDMRYRQKLEKQAEERLKVRQELEHYLNTTLRLEEEQKKQEEILLHEEELKIQAKHDKELKLKEEQRRRNDKDHSAALLSMIEEKRREKNEAMNENVKEYEYLNNLDEKMQQELEVERARLLQSQPPEILRFLPRGFLRESDRKIICLPEAQLTSPQPKT